MQYIHQKILFCFKYISGSKGGRVDAYPLACCGCAKCLGNPIVNRTNLTLNLHKSGLLRSTSPMQVLLMTSAG